MGKARTFSDAARESVYQKEFDDELYNTAAQQNSYNLGSVHFSDQSGIANITQAGSDQRKANLKGALFTGNIGFALNIVSLNTSTDTINLLEDSSGSPVSLIAGASIVVISGGGTTADLITILGRQRLGQRLSLTNVLTQTITIKHTATATPDTIRTPDGQDFIFNENMEIDFHYDDTTSQWRIVSGVSNGSGGSTSPLTTKGDLFTFDTSNARLPVGTDGQILTADSAESTGLKWSSASGGMNTDLSNMVSPTLPPVNLDLNQHDLTGVTGIDMDGASATLEGIVNLNFFQTSHEIDSLSGILFYQVDLSDIHRFAVGGTSKFELSSSQVSSFVDIDMNSNDIIDIQTLQSNNALIPTSGFIRMGTGQEIRMRNAGNDDDVIITSGNDALGNDSIIFNAEGTTVLTVSLLNLDVKDTNIIGTGDVLPRGQVHTVGDSTDYYAEMHSEQFIPESSSVSASLFGLSKIGNTIYINFDNTNVDAGFGIFEQGLQRFLFSRFGTTPFVNEFFIGGDPFLAGEEYRIQLGENSTSSARIFFIEGTGNDLILDRAGAGIDQGVQIRGAGLSIARFLSNSIKIFQPLDANAQDLFNVVDIKSNGGGGATTGTIGELITNDGGFNYFMRDTLAWENDPDKKLTMASSGITLETNGSNDDIDILAQGSSSDIDIFCNNTGQLTLGIFSTSTMTITNSSITLQGTPLVLTNGTEEIRFLDAVAGASVSTPSAGDISLFNDLTSGELSVKKSSGSVVSLEAGATGANTSLSNLSSVAINSNLNLNSGVDILPIVANTNLIGTTTLPFTSLFLNTALQFGATTRQIATSANNLLIRTSSGNDILFREDLTEFFRCDGGSNEIIFARDVVFNNPVSMGANLLNNTGDITPVLNLTFDLGTSSLLYANVFVASLFFDTNTQMVMSAAGISIFANNTNDDVFLTSDRSILVQTNSSGQVGFFSSFGNTKQTIVSDTLANLYTALRSYGLIG